MLRSSGVEEFRSSDITIRVDKLFVFIQRSVGFVIRPH